ncbi:hypothetical protein GL279_09085 [Paracoccus limosus]|uniref:Uncharacterized protein n=1 Tax=Paracoccus limosus TaxID=913252 RepID=A0A844H598_9RHOB|nr:hypothetical protein [Paracoccus limosus]MTH34753.1 hypothetical protein [Paracoccus limosus]
MSLRRARDELRAAGVFLAEPSMLREEAATIPLSQALAEGEGCAAQHDCRRLLAEARGDAPDLLLTEENILGGTRRGTMFSPQGVLYPFAVRRLRQAIDITGGGPVTLYLGLRDPADFQVSAFALQLALGNELELAPYLQGRDPVRVGWSGLVRRLLTVPGVAGIVVWRLEDYAAVRSQLLRMLLPGDLAARIPDPPPSNESLTQPGYDWFLSRAMADSEIDLRVLARRARARFPRSQGHPPLRLMDEATRARSARAYAAEIARIGSLPGVTLLQP